MGLVAGANFYWIGTFEGLLLTTSLSQTQALSCPMPIAKADS